MGCSGSKPVEAITAASRKEQVASTEVKPVYTSFTVSLERKTDSEEKGIKVIHPDDKVLLVAQVMEEGLVFDWNTKQEAASQLCVRAGDSIVAVNEVFGDAAKMLDAFKQVGTIVVKLQRPVAEPVVGEGQKAAVQPVEASEASTQEPSKVEVATEPQSKETASAEVGKEPAPEATPEDFAWVDFHLPGTSQWHSNREPPVKAQLSMKGKVMDTLLRVTLVKADGLLANSNAKHENTSEARVQAGDKIVAVNDVSGDAARIFEAIKTDGTLILKVQHAVEPLNEAESKAAVEQQALESEASTQASGEQSDGHVMQKDGEQCGLDAAPEQRASIVTVVTVVSKREQPATTERHGREDEPILKNALAGIKVEPLPEVNEKKVGHVLTCGWC